MQTRRYTFMDYGTLDTVTCCTCGCGQISFWSQEFVGQFETESEFFNWLDTEYSSACEDGVCTGTLFR